MAGKAKTSHMSPYHMMLHTYRSLVEIKRMMGCGDENMAYGALNTLIDELTERMKTEAARRGGLGIATASSRR